MGIRGRSTVQWMLTPAFLFPLSILQVLVDDHTCNVQEISTFLILHRTLGYYFLPLADLAVDWINDELVLDRQGLQADRGVQSEDFS